MSLSFQIASAEGTMLDRLRQPCPYIIVEDEYYTALLPCFVAIGLKTNKLIDLYDWVEFTGNELDILSEEFKSKKFEMDSATEPIVANIGKETYPDGSTKELIYHLEPSSVSSLLQRCLDLIGLAKIAGKVFICKGD